MDTRHVKRGRGRPFPKGHVPHNKTQHVRFTCEWCGGDFEVVPSRVKYNPRTCNFLCHNRLVARENKELGRVAGKKNGTWAGGIQTYRRFRKSACERCGSARFLVVHHKNEDRYDNRLENLETLCKRCHQIHHGCVANLNHNHT